MTPQGVNLLHIVSNPETGEVMKTVVKVLLITVYLSVSGSMATAQGFPNRPVRIVVPATPGNPSDIVARIIGSKLAEIWGQPIVFENRSGACGTMGAAHVAKATPDGYTLLIAVGAFIASAALQPNLPYDPIKDFAGVAQLGFPASALVVSPAIGIKSVTELIAFGKAHPGKMFFGSAGAGGGSHLQGERVRLAAGIKAVHVGFKGQPEAMIEVLAGRVHYGVFTYGAVHPLIKDGRLLALGVNTPQRLPQLPDVPALSESLPEFKRPETTNALLAPAQTPRPIVDKISKDIKRVLESADIIEKFNAISYAILPSTPEEQDKIRRNQIEVLTKLAIASGLRSK
jgi:tripartite-type tricarboxylate transporter receptor subunit TctC